MKRPDNLLFRSRIEIVRILTLLAQEKCSVKVKLKGDHTLESHLIWFHPGLGRIAIAFSPHKHLNALLLTLPSAELTATDKQGLFFTFEVSRPEEQLIDGQPAIQFDMPQSLYLHNQREFPRFPSPAPLSLRCVADEGGIIPFESHVTDISHDGLGCLVYEPDVHLEPGAVLKDCRIVLNNGDAVIVDLALRHITPLRLPDGSAASRAGFHIANKGPELDKLIGVFIRDLDKK